MVIVRREKKGKGGQCDASEAHPILVIHKGFEEFIQEKCVSVLMS